MALVARLHALLNRRPDEAAEVRQLRHQVAGQLGELHLDQASGRRTLATAIAEEIAEPPIADYLADFLERLFQDETYFTLPPPDPDATTAGLWNERDTLRIQTRILADFDSRMGTVEALLRTALPTLSASTEPSLFATPIHAQIRDFPKYLEQLIQLIFCEEVETAELFLKLRARIAANLDAIDEKQLRLPTRHPSRDPLELIDAYFHGTPFPDFFTKTVPLPVSNETFFSHMHVVGGSGAGKTQWLQTLILHHLQKDDPPSLVIVDSQGDLIDRLSHLALFDPDGGKLAERLVLISPKDIAHPPAINVFDINRDRFGRYDQATREQVVAGVIETFDYLFSGLIGADLTAKQSVFSALSPGSCWRFPTRWAATPPSST